MVLYILKFGASSLLQLPLQAKDMLVRLTGNQKLAIDVNIRVCLSVLDLCFNICFLVSSWIFTFS